MSCYLKTQTDKEKRINVQTSYYCKLCLSCANEQYYKACPEGLQDTLYSIEPDLCTTMKTI